MTSRLPARRVLVVDDEPGMREMCSILFRREGYDVTAVGGYVAAADALLHAPAPFGVVMADVTMPDGSGLDLLEVADKRGAGTQVVVMTAHSTVELALDAMRRGAYDFVTKPFVAAEVRALVAKAFEKADIVAENARLRAQVDRQSNRPEGLLGRSPAMARILELLQRIAPTKSTVLVTGESGTGKERIARAVHQLSDRAAAPFLVVNCGAIPEALLESELFGHEKGAFTGAVQRKLGIFREAEGGTVLLDELGELPLPMQVKLLRVLQEKKVRGVGEAHETALDVRVVAATNRPVEDDVKAGRIRQDLYYRLNVIRVEVPPLRERREDVTELAAHFLERCAKEHGKDVRGFSDDALRALDAHPFPGNVRELENVVERAVALATGPTIGLGDLPREVSGLAASPTPALLALPEEGCQLDDVLGEVERRLILQALERSGGVRTHAAKLLGVTFRSLRYRLQKLGLASEDDEPVSEREPFAADSDGRLAAASETPPGSAGAPGSPRPSAPSERRIPSARAQKD